MRPITRRAFVAGAAGLVGSGYLATLTGLGLPLRMSTAFADTVSPPSLVPDFQIAAEREADLVLLDFSFYGFNLETVKGTPTLVPTVTTDNDTGTLTSNIVVVQLPPQCIGEAEYPVNPADKSYPGVALPVDPPPIASAVSGPSRLCFTLGSGVSVPLPTMTVADLLDWTQWTLVVPLTAQINPPNTQVGSTYIPPYPLPYEPGPFETSIEFPYALFIAPVVFVSAGPSSPFELNPGYDTFFTARKKPLDHDGLVDVWTATLGRTNTLAGILEMAPTPPPQVVAVWAADYFDPDDPPSPLPNATKADQIYYGVSIP